MICLNYNLLNVGLGGQGVIKAIEIISWAALKSGYEVRTAETHGMAQRGGSVIAYLRFGSKIRSPFIPKGQANSILAFELFEALRYANYAGKDTIFIINDELKIPTNFQSKKNKIAERSVIKQKLMQQFNNVYIVNGHELSLKVGNVRTQNVVMLGILSGIDSFPIEQIEIEAAIQQNFPENLRNLNLKAFRIGMEKGLELKEQY